MRPFLSSIATPGCLFAVLLAAGGAGGQEKSPAQPASPPRGGAKVVVATVGDEPINAADVERLLGEASGNKEVNPAALPLLQAQVLSEIVNRRLVMAYARRTGIAPSQAEIDTALTEVRTKLELQHRSLEDYLARRGLTMGDLRRQAAWSLVWPKCLAKYVTDQRLSEYFQQHRRQFDGSQVSVSHILLGLPREAGPRTTNELVHRAEGIREEIVSGKISFAAAAAKYSSGPSAAKGGELGFIQRHGAMVESFARAAFALEPGEVSRPVVTTFGVHLIRAGEIKPGGKQLADVRVEVREALARELLERLAEIERRHTPVTFTGTSPYFKPGTKELASP